MSLPESDPSAPRSPDLQADRRTAFHELLGLRLTDADQGRGRLELTLGPEHLRSFGIAHGGVTAALLDTVMGMATKSLTPPDHYVVTIQLNVNFIRPAWQGETLVASGEVIHSGRQTAVARGEVRTSKGALVASGSATFFYVPHGERVRDPVEGQGRPDATGP